MEDFILSHNDYFVAVFKVENFSFQNYQDSLKERSVKDDWLIKIPKTKFFHLSGDDLPARFCVILSESASISLMEFTYAAQDFAQKMAFEILPAGEHRQLLGSYSIRDFLHRHRRAGCLQ